ncbi:hypothetical protein [Bacillus testis]|uniref:hypothetical protein n=1 Tax=Bacillus testis TaxID=1622072 RepID=UPI00067EAFB2|nr:hypothetical protein [Bacillus testis]
MTHKTFAYTVFTMVTAIVLLAAGFVYYMDPLWMFGSSHAFNDVQTVIDERQQKSDHIRFQPFDYEALLIGSSRTTYINQHDFANEKVYNYAASNMSVREYKSFIEYAKQYNGKEFDTVYIGLDFFKSSIQESAAPRSLDHYIEKQNESFYRLKNTLSWDSVKYAWTNLKMSVADTAMEERNYNRENVAFAKKVPPEQIRKQTEKKIEKFKEKFYGESYQYNPEYANYLREVKEMNPHTKFVAFTTPISTPLFQAMVESGRLPDYKRWLADIVSVFGEVHNFMYPNSVTDDLGNYFDGHHFYPETGTLIAQKLSNIPEKVPADFGMIVTGDNLEDHLAIIDSHSKLLAQEKPSVTIN